MSDKKSIDLGLTSALDELFMDDQGRKENALPKIYDIPLSEIDDFPDHPFHVRNDEDMDQLVDSIKERGIITPVMLRQKDDGRFEMVSGHRRKRAFGDVPRGSYYETAVLWLTDFGIVGGTGNGNFSPKKTCTRAEVVTMLYRVDNNNLLYK